MLLGRAAAPLLAIAARGAAVSGAKPVVRPHERDYADLRTHLRRDHNVQANGTVRLATFLRHQWLHGKGIMAVPHTHAPRRQP